MEIITTIAYTVLALIMIPLIILFHLADSFYKTFKKVIDR